VAESQFRPMLLCALSRASIDLLKTFSNDDYLASMLRFVLHQVKNNPFRSHIVIRQMSNTPELGQRHASQRLQESLANTSEAVLVLAGGLTPNACQFSV
jgi:hypothetical protein